MIIGISAKKQGGKTTAMEGLKVFLHKEGRSVATINFSDELKRIVLSLFVPKDMRLCLSDLNDEAAKQLMLPCGKTIRQVLQEVGTDCMRGIDPKCWEKAWLDHVAVYDGADCDILVSDIRFPNEVEAVQRLGGVVIRLMRAPLEDNHESETALDKWIGFDGVIDNRKMSIEEQVAATTALIVERGWL